MKQPFSKLSTLALAASFTLISACGGSGDMAEIEDTPEGEAYMYRHAVMEVSAYKASRLAGMAREEIPLDEEVFVKSAQDLAEVSDMILEGFMTEGIVGPSRATQDIWENWEDFQQQAEAFQESAEMLAAAADEEGFEGARGMVQDTLGMCGDCHRPYRASEAE